MDGHAHHHHRSPRAGAAAAATHAAATPARMNLFQRLVRQWDDLHPYNAAQAMKLQGPPDMPGLRAAWHDALDALGLGKVRVRGHGYVHECLNGESATHTVRLAPAGTCVQRLISDELNHPFAADEAVPFRPFVVQEGDDAHWVGVVYQHWIADSVSIRMLLREWFLRKYDPAAASQRPVRMAGGYWNLFGPQRARWELGEGILSSIRWSSRFRRVRRVEDGRFCRFDTTFSQHRAAPDLIDPLRAAARDRGATVNDLFLAAIAEACDKHGPVKRTCRRQDLALGSIVDLRPHVHEDLSDAFGLFLGFTSVICRPRHFADFETLIAHIARQTALQKRSGVPEASLVRILAGLAAGRLLSKEKVVHFYRKRVPLAGGISNVNMNATWAAKYHPAPLLDYLRVSPTGPMMPLVFTTTTLGNALSVGLTRRRAVVDDVRAEQLVLTFLDRLHQIAGISPSPAPPVHSLAV